MGLFKELPSQHEYPFEFLVEVVPTLKDSALEIDVPKHGELSIESFYELKPVVLDDLVENFDPLKRALNLAKIISRKWCGVYQPCDSLNKVEVTIDFHSVPPIG